MSLFSRKAPIATVAFNMKPKRSAAGGGNQWMNQLSAYLRQCGYKTVFDLSSKVDCVMGTHAGLSNDLTYSYDDVLRAKERNPRLRCIQRINDNDVRKGTAEMNPLLARANRAADHTVFVSQWLRDHHSADWFDATKPHSIILNGADPAVFHPLGALVWRPGQPLRFCTHHWSDNMAKGFDVYQEMDRQIAAGLLKDVELWIIGRWPTGVTWQSAKTFPPCSGDALASLLRQCHACVTASRFEPGAMHPVEAMQCGLPLLYHHDSGGTVELGQKFGVLLSDDLVSSIEELKAKYSALRHAVLQHAPSGDGMCAQYRHLIQSVLCT